MISCLILAAGEGTRLRPFTNDCPKGLVELLGKPLVSHQIATLVTLGVEDIAIVTGYKSEKFEKLGYPTYFNSRFKTTNMVESLFSARTFFEKSKDDLIISYGDIVYQKENLELLLKTKGDIVVMVDDDWLNLWSARNENPLNDAETLKYTDYGAIIELGKKPTSLKEIQGQYTGLIKISNHKLKDFVSFYDKLDRDDLYDGMPLEKMYMTSFLQLLIDAGWAVMPARVSNGWLEVDTVQDLALYEKLALKGKLSRLWMAHE